jgi:hypothetical protein
MQTATSTEPPAKFQPLSKSPGPRCFTLPSASSVLHTSRRLAILRVFARRSGSTNRTSFLVHHILASRSAVTQMPQSVPASWNVWRTRVNPLRVGTLRFGKSRSSSTAAWTDRHSTVHTNQIRISANWNANGALNETDIRSQKYPLDLHVLSNVRRVQLQRRQERTCRCCHLS